MAKQKQTKTTKNRVWRFTAELPKIGLILAGATATEEEIKALLSAGLRECTYLIDL